MENIETVKNIMDSFEAQKRLDEFFEKYLTAWNINEMNTSFYVTIASETDMHAFFEEFKQLIKQGYKVTDKDIYITPVFIYSETTKLYDTDFDDYVTCDCAFKSVNHTVLHVGIIDYPYFYKKFGHLKVTDVYAK